MKAEIALLLNLWNEFKKRKLEAESREIRGLWARMLSSRASQDIKEVLESKEGACRPSLTAALPCERHETYLAYVATIHNTE